MAARVSRLRASFPNIGRWPRRWDARLNLTVNTGGGTDVPADPGRVYGFDCPGVVIPLGQWSGIEMATLEAPMDFAPLQPGLPLPHKVRLRSTGASATAPQLTLAFWALTDEEQREMGSAMVAALASAAATLSGPFPPATALNDADPNPTTTRVGANVLAWDGANWERWLHKAWNADNAPVPSLTPAVNAYATIKSDRTGTSFPLRQPNATAPKSILQSAISIQTTGVKATRTMAQDGYIRAATVSPLSGTPTGAVILAQIVRSATTFVIGSTQALTASLNVTWDALGVASTGTSKGGISVLAGDVVQLNVVVAAGAAAAADFMIGFEEALYTI